MDNPTETTGLNVTGTNILLVDDQPDNLNVLVDLLSDENYGIRVCRNGATALELAQRFAPDLILLDVMMPGMDGFEVCRRLKANPNTRDIPVIFITARVETDDIVTGFQVGGIDYILKPFQDAELKARVATQLRLRRLVIELTRQKETLEKEIAQREAVEKERDHVLEERDHLAGRLSLLSDEEAKRWGIDGFIGKSKILREIFTSIERLQQNAGTSVLITGESGTGKELIARAIHFGSGRANSPFVPINCSAVPPDLADSLFFGHTKGAFTGADHDRLGYFEIANNGTLFLDEVGDMPLDLQAKLLRVLEDRNIRPVGGQTQKPVNVRILAATNSRLETSIQNGTFRQDLYYRLAGFPVHVPPLRERKEDIPLLAQHFLNLFGTEMGLHQPAITSDAIDILSTYSFPGNVRELKNIIERALIQSSGQPIKPLHLSLGTPPASPISHPGSPQPSNVEDLPLNLKQAELALIKKALRQANGNIAGAARLLGINRMKIYRRLSQDDEIDQE